jgi:PAS domain S-box-containing protein
MKVLANKKSILGLIVISIIILTSGYIIDLTLAHLGETQQSVQNTYIVIDKTSLALSLIQDIETGSHGYIITKNQDFLEPYNTAVVNIHTVVKELQDLSSNNLIQQERLSKLEVLVNQKIEYSTGMIELVNTGKIDQAIESISSAKGKQLMDAIRQTIKEMKNTEYTLLNDRSNQVHESFSYLSNLSIMTSVIIIITVIIVYVILDKDTKVKTKQKQKQQLELTDATAKQLSETSQYARSLIEASLDPLVTINLKGKITDVNEATVKITGVSRENLIGTDFSRYFTEPRKAREGYERVFNEGSVTDYPLSIRHLSGQTTDVFYNASIYKDDKGNVLGVFAAARDITERKKVEKQQLELTDATAKTQLELTDATAKTQLELTDATAKTQLELTDATALSEKLKGVAKDEFSAMITHELNTPLVPIIGYCKMFKTSMLGGIDQEQLEAIEVIEKNAKRLETLITDIMDVRKLDLDQMKFKIDDLSLDEFFSNLDSDYKKILENKRCQFITNQHVTNIIIKTDKSRLRQVFDNLISNAIKFVSENKGKIETGYMKENNKLVFYVKDNGIGILQEKQKELFQKFYQIDTSERRSAGGTGLGLAISKGIVEKLGGTISVESDGKTGTTFYMKFPL